MHTNNNNIDFNEIPIKAFRRKTRDELSLMLNGTKVIPSPSGLQRDWRGLADLMKVKGFSCFGENHTEKILQIKEKDESQTFAKFQQFLREMDRYDALDRTVKFMEDDALFYLTQNKGISVKPEGVGVGDGDVLTTGDVYGSQQNYDAFVLFVDDDIDFATTLIQTLENKYYGLKLCVKERDLIGGTFEHEAIVRLISERCNRLIVILSPEFLKSEHNKFFVYFAQSIGIEQRKRKVIPCLYKTVKLLPDVFRGYFLLDYTRSNALWNFWDKLRDSIVVVPQASIIQYTIPQCILPSVPTESIMEVDDHANIQNKIVITDVTIPDSPKKFNRKRSIPSLIKPLTQIFKTSKKKNKSPLACSV